MTKRPLDTWTCISRFPGCVPELTHPFRRNFMPGTLGDLGAKDFAETVRVLAAEAISYEARIWARNDNPTADTSQWKFYMADIALWATMTTAYWLPGTDWSVRIDGNADSLRAATSAIHEICDGCQPDGSCPAHPPGCDCTADPHTGRVYYGGCPGRRSFAYAEKHGSDNLPKMVLLVPEAERMRQP